MALRIEGRPFLQFPRPDIKFPDIFSKEQTKEASSNQQKTPMEFVRMILETLKFTDKHKQDRLITHQLRALLKEYLGVPFHSYAMVVGEEADQLSFFDDIYFRSSVLQRCEDAIHYARLQGDKHRERRYGLEKMQVEQLIQKVQAVLEVVKYAPELSGKVIGMLSQEGLQSYSPENLLALNGWAHATDFLSEEVLWQLELDPNTSPECYLGPKFLYIMPQSSVHKGWKSMYVIAQPAYLPLEDKWVILQDQHMAEVSWERHARFIRSFTGKKTPKIQKKEMEAWLMEQTLPLPEEYQIQKAADTFIQLLHDGQYALLSTQQKLIAQVNFVEETLPLHCEYLRRSVEKISSREEVGSPLWSEWVYQAVSKTLLSVLHEQKVERHHIEKWIGDVDTFMRTGQRLDPWKVRAVHLKESASVANWLNWGIISKIECVSLSIPSALSKNGQFMQSLASGKLGKAQLIEAIGRKRAQEWMKKGERICVNPSCKKLGFTGECGLCLLCELKDSGDPSFLSNLGRSGKRSDDKHAFPHDIQETVSSSSFRLTPENVITLSQALSRQSDSIGPSSLLPLFKVS